VVAAWAAVDDVAGAIDGDDGVVAGAGVDAVGILAAVEPFVARAAFQDVPSAGNTRDGLAAARARGRKGGRRPRLAPEQVLLAQELYDAGERTVQQIADLFGVPRTTVYGHLKGSGQRPRGAAAVAAPDESPS
jgi:hypothetical protein